MSFCCCKNCLHLQDLIIFSRYCVTTPSSAQKTLIFCLLYLSASQRYRYLCFFIMRSKLVSMRVSMNCGRQKPPHKANFTGFRLEQFLSLFPMWRRMLIRVQPCFKSSKIKMIKILNFLNKESSENL